MVKRLKLFPPICAKVLDGAVLLFLSHLHIPRVLFWRVLSRWKGIAWVEGAKEYAPPLLTKTIHKFYAIQKFWVSPFFCFLKRAKDASIVLQKGKELCENKAENSEMQTLLEKANCALGRKISHPYLNEGRFQSPPSSRIVLFQVHRPKTRHLLTIVVLIKFGTCQFVPRLHFAIKHPCLG